MTTRDNDRRVRKTKLALEQAFLELLAEKDLDRITVKELAERADITRKTFYLHYSSIEAFVEEVVAEKLPESFSQMERLYINNGEFDFKSFFVDLTGFLDAHDGYFRTLFLGHSRRKGVVFQVSC